MSFENPGNPPLPEPYGNGPGFNSPPTPGPAHPEQRRRNLANALQMEVAAGWRVESQTDESAVLVKGGSTNHVLHLILTLISCGAWGLVWIAMVFINQRKAIVLRVDDYGNVLRNQA